MEKSLVGDPIYWPGLIYSPLNSAGLLFALGSIANSTGLLFEEFSDDFATAICRRKTDAGWQRLRVEFAYRSSDHSLRFNDIDLLICWIDDVTGDSPPRLVLSQYYELEGAERPLNDLRPKGLDSILPTGAADDLMARGQSRESYEETVRLLDAQIKKLKSG